MLKGLIKRVQASKAIIGLHNNKVTIKETQTMGTITVVDHNILPVFNNHEIRMREMCLPRASSSHELPREREEVAIEVEEPYFLEIFKKLQINLSLADALREMPQYAKFLKDIITNKRSWDSGTTVPIPEVCSSIILNDLPAKLKNPGSFSIPCTIGNMSSINCLCDLGASINLMPLTLFRTLCGDQTVKSTSMVLQQADHSLKRPFGIVEDVLVKVDKFIFPVDFVILDYAVDKECPMILGRPFMNTGRALIDVHGGKLTL
ncbi:uncharacterized protein LOC126687762 [Mercurialis annua]|uniref:uncharacterized protein LOC126687762 n=1 Tax=Mercurialis annua TaxID=3986 RepID=UPI002160064A|nr:uncharacterized protein LOC126687762 [Mercurialis annua]